MARGKIEIKRIENSTNRQVTYSKRRSGLFKKANELAVLCDARVSIIMISSTEKVHEFVSPNTTLKQIIDEYQQKLEKDLWSSHYERNQGELKKLQETNNKLRREIRQRLGEDLSELELADLCGLEQNMESSLKIIRERRDKVISGQIQTFTKKYKQAEKMNMILENELAAREEDSEYGLVDNGRNYDPMFNYYSNGGPRSFPFHMQPREPNMHTGAGSCLTSLSLLK